MKKFIFLVIPLLIVFNGYSQTKEIYVNPNFGELTKDHKILAILPFKAIVKLRPKEMEKMTEEQFEDLEENEGLAVQSALHSYFLKRKSKHDFEVSFQDINTTNALLAKNGINNANIDHYTPQELAKMLEVDGIISGTLSTSKPMSEGASAALGVLVGVYGPTNSGKCTININDMKSGELLWKYEKTLSRSLGSDTNTVINTIMRKASRKLPYIEK